MQLLAGEVKLITVLRKKNIDIIESTVSIILVTRKHNRPKKELLDIISHYPNLSDKKQVYHKIEEMVKKGLIEITELENIPYYSASQKLIENIKSLDSNNTLTEIDYELRVDIDILGRLEHNTIIYTSYLDLLRSANDEIILPMLSTSAEMKSVEILKERALNGVSIKILLGSPKLVKKIRGASSASDILVNIEKWSNHSTLKNYEVKLTDRIVDAELSTCILIDGNILRYDVFDPKTQRTLQGTMLEIRNPDGKDYNIVRQFKRSFSEAWNQGYYPNDNQVKKFIKRNIGKSAELVLAILCLVIYVINKNNEVIDLITGNLGFVFIYSVIDLRNNVKKVYQKMTDIFYRIKEIGGE